MPDSVTFNSIPIDVRTPGQYVEIDHTKALRGLPSMQRRMLFIGNKLAVGTAVAGQLYRINNPAEAATLFGRGSVLQEMLTPARNANRETEMWALGLTDNAGGTQATFTATVTGPATAAGSIALYINGNLLTVPVANGDSATVVAASIVAAVTAWLDSPFTAANAAGVVTLTHKHKGTFGSDANIRVSYQPDEKLPAGIAVAVAVGVAGAGNPDMTTALASIAQEAFYTITTPWNDATNVGKAETELAARWNGMDMRTGHVFVGFTGTHAANTTFGAARNSPHSTVVGCRNTPNPCYVVAAVFAAVCEFNGAIDPARPFQTLALPSMLAPAQADRFTRQERDLLLRSGISTFTVDQGGNLAIERVVTTYQTNAYGLADVSLLDLETKWTADYMRFAFRARIGLRFPRHKLADDGTSFAPGQAIVTPRMIRGELLDVARQLELAGILEGLSDFKADLIVMRSVSDVNRVNAILPTNVVNQFRVFAASVQFIL